MPESSLNSQVQIAVSEAIARQPLGIEPESQREPILTWSLVAKALASAAIQKLAGKVISDILGNASATETQVAEIVKRAAEDVKRYIDAKFAALEQQDIDKLSADIRAVLLICRRLEPLVGPQEAIGYVKAELGNAYKTVEYAKDKDLAALGVYCNATSLLALLLTFLGQATNNTGYFKEAINVLMDGLTHAGTLVVASESSFIHEAASVGYVGVLSRTITIPSHSKNLEDKEKTVYRWEFSYPPGYPAQMCIGDGYGSEDSAYSAGVAARTAFVESIRRRAEVANAFVYAPVREIMATWQSTQVQLSS